MPDYTFIKFEKSLKPTAKYDAVLKHIKSGKLKRVPFGSKKHEQYKDSTGLGLYSHKDHLDIKRRSHYRLRHGAKGYQLVEFSPAYYAWHFLW